MKPRVAVFERHAWGWSGASLALAACLTTCGLAVAQPPKADPSQSQKTVQPKAQTGTKPSPNAIAPRGPDWDLDQKTNQARDEIEMLELQLETKRAQLRLAEARRAESKRWKSIFEQLRKDGFASEERYIAARDDLLMHESNVEAEKSSVQEAELRVKQAKRRLAYGEFPVIPQESRIAEIEQRLGSLEKGLNHLQQEIGSLRRLTRVRWTEPDQTLPPTTLPR